MSEYIKCAAIQIISATRIGNTFDIVVTGKYHGECFKKVREQTVQGFIAHLPCTNCYRFVGRKEALKIAIAADQTIEKHKPLDRLLSEDLRNDERFNH